MNPELLLAFIGATAVLAFMPGPDNIYVLTESISRGARQGVSITAGLVSGVVIHTLLVATGLSLLVFESAWGYTVLKYAGAAYLLYLAWGASRERPMKLETSERAPAERFGKLFTRGLTMNILNPKVAVFFIAFLPQFVSSAGWDPFWQMSLMGVVFMLESFVIFSTIALLADRLTAWVEHPAFWHVTKWIKVSVLLGLAILLVFSDQ